MTRPREIPKDCRKVRGDAEIVLRERRSVMRFENPRSREVEVVDVDGCAITDPAIKRCDYLVRPAGSRECFVELKGNKVGDGANQIESTIHELSKPQRPKLCFVVATRIPRLDTKIQRLKQHFRKSYNATLIVQTTPCTHSID